MGGNLVSTGNGVSIPTLSWLLVRRWCWAFQVWLIAVGRRTLSSNLSISFRRLWKLLDCWFRWYVHQIPARFARCYELFLCLCNAYSFSDTDALTSQLPLWPCSFSFCHLILICSIIIIIIIIIITIIYYWAELHFQPICCIAKAINAFIQANAFPVLGLWVCRLCIRDQPTPDLRLPS